VISQCGTMAGQRRWLVYVRLGKCLRSKCGGQSNGKSNDTSVCGEHNSSPDVSLPLLLDDNLSATTGCPQAFGAGRHRGHRAGIGRGAASAVTAKKGANILKSLAGARGLLELSNLNRLAESGAISRPVATADIPRCCPTNIPTRFGRFLAKATIAQQARSRRGTIGGFVQASENESAVPLASQTRCGRLWGKSRPRKMLTRSGTCRGTRGSG
jgi:hypothetical protein